MTLLAQRLVFLCLSLNTFAGAQTPGIHDFIELYDHITSYAQDEDDSIPRQLVRLGFHDAWGGVDGFIDTRDQKHAGLVDVVDFLNTLYDGYQTSSNRLSSLSKADFFSWAYIVGFYYTVPVANIPWVSLRYGRATFEGSIIDSPEELAPPGYEVGGTSRDSTLEYFESVFGFNEVNTTILMGAHTLRKGSCEYLGFEGELTKDKSTFNTEYYKTIVSPTPDPEHSGWQQVAIHSDETRYQWSWGCSEQNDSSGEKDDGKSSKDGEHRLRGLQDIGIGDVSTKKGEQKGGNTEEGGNNRKGCRDLMLNVDMNLYYDISSYMDESGKVLLPSNFPAGAPEFCGTDGIVWAECFPVRESSDSWIVVDYFGTDKEVASHDQIFYNAFAEVYGSLLSHKCEENTPLNEVEKPDVWPPLGFVTGAVPTDPVYVEEFAEVEGGKEIEGSSEENDGAGGIDVYNIPDSSLLDNTSGSDADSSEFKLRDEVEGDVGAYTFDLSNATSGTTSSDHPGYPNKLIFVFFLKLVMICLCCCGCFQLGRMRKIDPEQEIESNETECKGDPNDPKVSI